MTDALPDDRRAEIVVALRAAGARFGGRRRPARSSWTSCRGCTGPTRTSGGASSVVDEARVLVLLRSIRADLAFLDRESGADDSRRADEAWLRGIEYAFVTAIEG
ncbi:hypothetical protein [Actinomycetospora sp. CA-084318]|uniref:hypothetical protein n=1 Tax=Actinomycetospora sp. CA-084318 TaxID=3239892 RepID=UPI003D9937D3